MDTHTSCLEIIRWGTCAGFGVGLGWWAINLLIRGATKLVAITRSSA